MSKVLTEMPKVGEKVRYLKDEWSFMTQGAIYTVRGIAGNEFITNDDDGNDTEWDYTELSKFEHVELDAVNSPSHYKRGEYETIDIIEHITAGYSDPFVAYCVGSTVKYVDRAPFKHDSPAECLRKAAWYLTRAADHIEASE